MTACALFFAFHILTAPEAAAQSLAYDREAVARHIADAVQVEPALHSGRHEVEPEVRERVREWVYETAIGVLPPTEDLAITYEPEWFQAIPHAIHENELDESFVRLSAEYWAVLALDRLLHFKEIEDRGQGIYELWPESDDIPDFVTARFERVRGMLAPVVLPHITEEDLDAQILQAARMVAGPLKAPSPERASMLDEVRLSPAYAELQAYLEWQRRRIEEIGEHRPNLPEEAARKAEAHNTAATAALVFARKFLLACQEEGLVSPLPRFVIHNHAIELSEKLAIRYTELYGGSLAARGHAPAEEEE